MNSPKTQARFQNTASEIGGSIITMRSELEATEAEIKANRLGKAEYEREVFKLKERQALLQARVKKNKEWVTACDPEGTLGPLLAKYAALVEEIKSLYGTAKEKHAQGIALLMQEFAYHPAYKRWSDEFSAVPYKPK
eukprot:jgi/Mesvir1/7451/Mv19226-RA.1